MAIAPRTNAASAPPATSMNAMATSSTAVSRRSGQHCVHAFDLCRELAFVEHRTRAVDVDLVIDADPASAAAVRFAIFDVHWPRKLPGTQCNHVQRLIGTKAKPRRQRLFRQYHQRREPRELWREPPLILALSPRSGERGQCPHPDHLAPMRDRDCRTRLRLALMEVRRVELETLRLDSER